MLWGQSFRRVLTGNGVINFFTFLAEFRWGCGGWNELEGKAMGFTRGLNCGIRGVSAGQEGGVEIVGHRGLEISTLEGIQGSMSGFFRFYWTSCLIELWDFYGCFYLFTSVEIRKI